MAELASYRPDSMVLLLVRLLTELPSVLKFLSTLSSKHNYSQCSYKVLVYTSAIFHVFTVHAIYLSMHNFIYIYE